MLISEKEYAAEVLALSGVNAGACMKCGKCSASCPAAKNMDILPHQVVGDLHDGKINGLKKSKTLWKCASCFACAARCPKGIDPAKLIEAVRLSVIRKQGAVYLKADDVPALLDDNMPQQALVSAFRKYNK